MKIFDTITNFNFIHMHKKMWAIFLENVKIFISSWDYNVKINN